MRLKIDKSSGIMKVARRVAVIYGRGNILLVTIKISAKNSWEFV